MSPVARLRHHLSLADRDEIARQYDALDQIEGMRVLLTLTAYVVGMVYLPIWVPLALAAADITGDLLAVRLTRGLDPARQPWVYGLSLLAVVVAEGSYSLQAALIWQNSAPYAKALATGLVLLTLLQLSTVRTAHLAYALAGLATTVTTVIAAILWEWAHNPGAANPALLLFCALAAALFVLITMRSNHRIHQALARDQAAARAADRAKSRFLAQIGHELRTPLNAIIGLGHVEAAAATDPASRERLDHLLGSARNLATLLDDILDLSAIEEGRTPIRPVVTSPAAEVRGAATLYRPFFENAGMTLQLELERNLPDRARLDPLRLRQCLSNLLSNSLKHGRSTGGRVHLRARSPRPDQLEITLTDTGPGIAPEEAAMIFDPFVQGEGAGAGSGLGLAIARQIARAMGGDLTLVPSPRGASFLLRLGLQPAPAEAEAPPPPAPQADSRRPRRGARVLVVDDIASNRLVARAHLAAYGLSCDEAGCGESALTHIAADPPDLVLLDLSMPGLDGTATLHRIRALPRPASQTRVVAMTADPGGQVARLAQGFDGYLAKPLDPQALARLLLEQLGPERGAPAPPAPENDTVTPPPDAPRG